MMALKDWHDEFPSNLLQHTEIDLSKWREQFDESIETLDKISIELDSHTYSGAVCDGRWWDTLLVILALLDTGAHKDRVVGALRHCLATGMQPCGGMAYGLEFEYCPDTDDTGIMVCFIAVILSFLSLFSPSNFLGSFCHL